MSDRGVLAPATGNVRMPLGTPTVVVEDVHVKYRVYSDKRRTLRDRVLKAWKPRRYREVHALKGVTFTAHAGEAIGVIGPNGSGKSTLMRVIAGLQPISDGAVYARATPMLLGVGAVLNKQLSGRRNILLGGLALGMSKADILAREEEIVQFAGIGQAIDLPMRTYSSGMSARLQFAISAAVEPEILIVDEALAVGDQAFRRKSNRRIRELRDAAGTVFLVSHSMATLLQTCTRMIWLEDGLIKADGDPREIVKAYRRTGRKGRGKKKRKQQGRKQQGRKQQRQRLITAEPPPAPAEPATAPSDGATERDERRATTN